MTVESGAPVSARTSAELLRSPALTALSVAVLAAMTPPLIHELIGHGSVCLAVGGHPTVISTSLFWCTVPEPIVAAGGPAANLLAGLICLLLRLRLRAPAPALLLYLTLVTAFAWFWEGGYAVEAMLIRSGDLYDLLAYTVGVPGIGISALISAAGAGLYIATAVITRRSLAALAGGGAVIGRVSQWSWLAGTLAVTIAALISPLGALNLLDTVLAIGIAGLPLLVLAPRRATVPLVGAPDAGKIVLPLVAVAAWVLFAATLGHGMTWGN